jgi:small-conductance mechanosensitive channel
MMVVTVLFLTIVPGSVAEPKSPVFGNVSTSTTAASIPLAEVALRAYEVSTFLQKSLGSSASNVEIESIRRSLPLFTSEIVTKYRETMLTLRGYSSLSGLQDQQQLWQQKQAHAATWLKALTTRANQLDESLDKLPGLQQTWALTLEAGRISDAPPELLKQIERTLAMIASARAPLQEQWAAVLDMQSRIASHAALCGNVLEEIARARQSVVKGAFQPNRPPLWRSWQWVQVREALPSYSRDVAITFMTEIKLYVSNFSSLIVTVVLFAVVLVLVFFARRHMRQSVPAGKSRAFASEIFEHPYSASLTVVLLALTSPFLPLSAVCKMILQAVSIVPMILLLRSAVEPRMIRWLSVLGVLFAMDTLRQLFSGLMSVGQAFLVLESIIAMSIIGLVMTRKELNWPSRTEFPAVRDKLARLIACLLLFHFTVSLLAAVTGFMTLARLLTPSVLVGGYLGLALYALVRLASAMSVFFLDLWPLRNLRIVQNRREFLERRLYIILIWGAVLGWLSRFLHYMGLLEPSVSFAKYALSAKFERGAIALSLGDVLAFALTLWIAYLLSSFLRFVLRDEIYPRLKVATGRSYAASSLLHYFILTIGFLVGIGLMGVDLTKVTVLAGALGVGIGFGLQGVVNNFVSGLILLFERPVSAGDNIEFGGLIGEVRRIGMRSSTVRTYQGADIIVPNSLLINEQVTNWTLSDKKRRIDLPLGVNYGAEPNEVMRLLEELTRSHADILRTPPPQCLFVGYGDSSINFELRAWTDKFNDWPQVKSDLVVAVYHAVYKAGMSFPFPQRDVHLVHDSQAAPSAVDSCPIDTNGLAEELETQTTGGSAGIRLNSESGKYT